VLMAVEVLHTIAGRSQVARRKGGQCIHQPSSQLFLKEHEPGSHLVTERPVGLMAYVIPKFGIRSHLAAASGTSPRFGRSHQSPAHPTPPYVLIDVPPFDVADGARVATAGPGA
jgi:hypothetical protein